MTARRKRKSAKLLKPAFVDRVSPNRVKEQLKAFETSSESALTGVVIVAMSANGTTHQQFEIGYPCNRQSLLGAVHLAAHRIQEHIIDDSDHPEA